MRSLIHLIFIAAFLCSTTEVWSQTETKKVLFIGNSYTSVNNLPQMIADVASSTGNTLLFDSSAPGGAFLCDQVMYQIYSGVTKIKTGGWDYVVLQDQSLAYTGYIPIYVKCAYRLDTLIKKYNSCSRTMFYVTWGRKDGMNYGSYQVMDSVIESNYMLAADSLRFETTPVGAIWRYLRTNHPTIELFDPDGSHPSPAGTYAAACGFYSTLFRKDPTQITFNSSLTPADASIIRSAAKQIVYDSLLKWHVGAYDSLMSGTCLWTGIPEETVKHAFQIFPNPASTMLTITYSNQYNTSNHPFEIYNATGQLLQKAEITSQKEIDIQHLLPGMYYLKFKNAPGEALKFIKL